MLVSFSISKIFSSSTKSFYLLVVILVSSSWNFFASIRLAPEVVLPDHSFYQFLEVCDSTVLHFKILAPSFDGLLTFLYILLHFFKWYFFFPTESWILLRILIIQTTNIQKYWLFDIKWHLPGNALIGSSGISPGTGGSDVRKMRQETLSSLSSLTELIGIRLSAFHQI